MSIPVRKAPFRSAVSKAAPRRVPAATPSPAVARVASRSPNGNVHAGGTSVAGVKGPGGSAVVGEHGGATIGPDGAAAHGSRWGAATNDKARLRAAVAAPRPSVPTAPLPRVDVSSQAAA